MEFWSTDRFLINFILDSDPKEIHIKHNKSQKRETIRQVSPNPNFHILKSVLISKCIIQVNNALFFFKFLGVNTWQFWILTIASSFARPCKIYLLRLKRYIFRICKKVKILCYRSRHVKPWHPIQISNSGREEERDQSFVEMFRICKYVWILYYYNLIQISNSGREEDRDQSFIDILRICKYV